MEGGDVEGGAERYSHGAASQFEDLRPDDGVRYDPDGVARRGSAVYVFVPGGLLRFLGGKGDLREGAPQDSGHQPVRRKVPFRIPSRYKERCLSDL